MHEWAVKMTARSHRVVRPRNEPAAWTGEVPVVDDAATPRRRGVRAVQVGSLPPSRRVRGYRRRMHRLRLHIASTWPRASQITTAITHVVLTYWTALDLRLELPADRHALPARGHRP